VHEVYHQEQLECDVLLNSSSAQICLRFYTTGFLSSGSNLLNLLRHIQAWVMAPGTVQVSFDRTGPGYMVDRGPEIPLPYIVVQVYGSDQHSDL